jgi:hypothetical protein
LQEPLLLVSCSIFHFCFACIAFSRSPGSTGSTHVKTTQPTTTMRQHRSPCFECHENREYSMIASAFIQKVGAWSWLPMQATLFATTPRMLRDRGLELRLSTHKSSQAYFLCNRPLMDPETCLPVPILRILRTIRCPPRLIEHRHARQLANHCPAPPINVSKPSGSHNRCTVFLCARPRCLQAVRTREQVIA